MQNLGALLGLSSLKDQGDLGSSNSSSSSPAMDKNAQAGSAAGAFGMGSPLPQEGNAAAARQTRQASGSCEGRGSSSGGGEVAVAQIVPLEEDGSTGSDAGELGGQEGAALAAYQPSWRTYLPNLLVDCSKQVCLCVSVCRHDTQLGWVWLCETDCVHLLLDDSKEVHM